MKDQTENIGALYAAIAAAQVKMGPLIRDAENSAFSRGKQVSKYATLAAVTGLVIPAFAAEGIAVIQMVETTPDGVIVHTSLCHSSGARIDAPPITIRPEKPNAHGIGSAVTYARRYALMAVAGVAPEDDDGNAASLPTQEPVKLVAPDTVLQIGTEIERTGADIEKVFRAYRVESLADLTADQAADALAKLRAKPDATPVGEPEAADD